ncbi:energy-coupling factor ABC transporter permease, partial [Nitrospirota bacterium]
MAGFGIFYLLRKLRVNLFISSFMAGLFADWATYAGTAFELTLGIRGDEAFMPLFLKIIIAFMPAQVPIGILEGFVTAGMVNLLLKRRPDILVRLNILKQGEERA